MAGRLGAGGSEEELAVAVRAIAARGVSRWLRRPVRTFTYAGRFADGSVRHSSSISALLPDRHTTDLSDLGREARSSCPDVGAGPWIDA